VKGYKIIFDNQAGPAVYVPSEGLAEDCKTHLNKSMLHFWKKNHETENMKFCWRRLFQIQRHNFKTSLTLGESLAGRRYKL
jgi:hypothetical protein